MRDQEGEWPAAGDIEGVDHDGDSRPGITAVPRDDGGFSAPPTSIAQTTFVDRMYLATRNVTTLTAHVEGCPKKFSGTAEIRRFENHVIGCHVRGAGECTASEATFVDSNRTIYKVQSATFTSVALAADASCADVRMILPRD